MIHILTVHFKSDKWIDLQLKQIDKHITNYKVWSYCDGFDISSHKHKFHYCGVWPAGRERGGQSHWKKLNKLSERVIKDTDTKDGDILIWMDSDTLPINNVNDHISERLSTYSLLAVNRLENAGDVIPHPSFACSTVAFWKKHNLENPKMCNWGGSFIRSKASPKRNRFGEPPGTYDNGGSLYFYLLDNNIEWYRMRRTHSLTDHPVYFTIYDNLVYHHAAGSRKSVNGTRYDKLNGIKNKYNTSEEIFNMISKDDFLINEKISIPT